MDHSKMLMITVAMIFTNTIFSALWFTTGSAPSGDIGEQIIYIQLDADVNRQTRHVFLGRSKYKWLGSPRFSWPRERNRLRDTVFVLRISNCRFREYCCPILVSAYS